MFSGHPQALIIPSPFAMTILKYSVITFFNGLNLIFVFNFFIKIFNKNVELELWTWNYNLNFKLKCWI